MGPTLCQTLSRVFEFDKLYRIVNNINLSSTYIIRATEIDIALKKSKNKIRLVNYFTMYCNSKTTLYCFSDIAKSLSGKYILT